MTGCCTRTMPCPVERGLWEAVATAHHRWTKTKRPGLKATQEGIYQQAQEAYDAHFEDTPVEQGAMPL